MVEASLAEMSGDGKMRFILTSVAVLGCGVVCLADYEKAPEPGNVPHVIRIRPGKGGRLRKGVGDVRDASWRLLFENSDDEPVRPCRSCEER